ncbi:MAG: hypothetical protein AABW51_04665 [Nanoarchaeota archaeon]
MNKEIVYFIISFLLPFIYYRTLFLIASRVFDKPILREKTGLKIHHIHYGMILTLISALVLLFAGKNVYVVILLGLGLGFMYDEFIPALLMKSKRSDELIVYKKAFKSTSILFLIIIIIILAVSLIIL